MIDADIATEQPVGSVGRLPPARAIRVGGCEVRPGSRTLLRDDAQVEIGSRAFDLLIILLRSRGEVVSKDEIVRHVWPTTIVEESNLRFQMAALRRALGEDRELIKTVPGRGYLIIMDDEPMASAAPPPFGGAGLGARESAIFIVEENTDVREALSRLLRPFSARVLSFRSLEALRAGGV